MAVPSPNVLLALFIISFSLSAIFHRSSHHNDTSPPSVFSHFAADISIPSTNDTFSSRPAAFGSEFPEHLGGRLVKAWGDGLACSDVASGADQRLATEYEGMIVLVQRGLCSFAEKVRRVQHAGGIAAIVGDNTAGSGLLTMYAKGDTRDILIPSTFVPHTTYLSLSFLLSLPPPLDVVISPSTASDWPLLDTLLLVVLSPLFTLACIYFLLIVRRRVQRRRELAPISVVKSLPHRRWTHEKDDEESGPGTSGTNGHVTAAESPAPDTSRQPRRVIISECVVCLEDFAEGDILITLPCNHEFHESCITPWLTTQRRLCPICKRDIITTQQTQQTAQGLSEQSPLLRNRDDEWRGETAATV